ncbi:methenyltetrahydromethanopterin cyclohydrolase [Methylocystis heyeri]|uniref:Methenyltetrahydromethanopterin cyclohydrolase n=1 Tax=Methylocystis heyeri TaxID=391905 RepID=A0A6B8K9C3_9HYPH|nr:methenyltetrahydromethanopterin cyclohydrolase [Methylocystis heyeri]QGM44884.1 methenyltetrahydromethanopterin cyclohydrolase [Methylocystis heyeri]
MSGALDFSGRATASVNKLAGDIVDRLVAGADRYRVSVSRGSLGELLIDAGAKAAGGVEAGLLLTEICMGGLGRVSLAHSPGAAKWPFWLTVSSNDPVVACLASQYAGWSLQHEKFFALGSGPGRAQARVEKLFEELPYSDKAERVTIVLEGDRPPPAEVVTKVAAAAKVEPANVAFVYAPTQSLAGSVQVVGRVLEVALHKAHELKFPLENIVDGIATAPLSPPHPDFIQAMGRTNDAIIYAGRAHLFVKGSAEAAAELAKNLPSSNSRDYGRPFAEVFKAYKGDFYKIDPSLFSPAEAVVTAIETGETFRAGAIDEKLLDASFG